MLAHSTGIEGGTMTTTTGVTDVTNAYTSFGGVAVNKDGRGNTTSLGNVTLVYDIFGHLVCRADLTNPSNLSSLMCEFYDAEGRRIYRETGATGQNKTYFIWEGESLIQEKDLTANVVTHEYVHGAGVDNVIGQRLNGTPFAVHSDLQSTPYLATTATGAIQEHYDTDPYGKTETTLGSGITTALDSHIGLHGGWVDPDNGRIYYRARIYDPTLARSLSRDPIGVWGDPTNWGNPYGFVGNNTTLLSDPSGLGWWSSIVDAVAGVADGAIQAVTFGIVDTPVVGNMVGADTSSVAYQAGTVIGEVATSAVMATATGGTCALARGLTTIQKGADLLDKARDIKDTVTVGIALANGDASGAADALLQKGANKLASKAAKGRGCFIAGTMVMTTNGLQAIETITAGTEVVSYDPASATWTTAEVIEPLSREYQGDFVTITTPSGDITATGNHPFFVTEGRDLQTRPIPSTVLEHAEATSFPEGRWVEARSLRSGDKIVSRNEDTVEIAVSQRAYGRRSVFNLDVTSSNTYAVSNLGLCVHNDGCGKDSTSAKGRADAIHASQVTTSGSTRGQNHSTTAVTETVEGPRIVSSSRHDLTNQQQSALRDGEIAASGPGHAEVTGVNEARNRGLTPTGTAASRPICNECQEFLSKEGVKPLSPTKN